MKIKTGTAYRLYQGLASVEQAQGVTFKGEVRLAFAINLNQLHPIAVAYESACARIVADLAKQAAKDGGNSEPEMKAAVAAADAKARDVEVEVKLQTVKTDDLELDTNAIPATMLALLMPMVTGAPK